MNVKVGSQLRWQGVPVVCTAISECVETKLASRGSDTWRADMQSLGNVKLLDFNVGQFEEGDVVKITSCRVELTHIGKNIFHIYTTYKVIKETNDDGSEGSQGSTGKTSHDEAESCQ